MRKHIDALRKKRNGHLDAMTAISDLAATENRLFTDDEQKAFDKDEKEIADIDAQIARFEAVERVQGQQARPAPAPLETERTAEVIPFRAFPGQAFTRMVGALALSKGNLLQAVEIAKRWEHQTPEVLGVLQHAMRIGNTNDPKQWLQRAAVAPGTTVHPTWAAPLVQYTRMSSEFIELLRAATVFNQLSGYATVPFNIKIPRQTAGATAQWVGEGLSKPVSSLAFDDVTLPWAKIAIIVVITQELARFSEPSAEMLVRDDLIATIAAFIDSQLLDDTITAIAGTRPASITNAAHKIPSTGSTVAAVTKDLTDAMLWMTQPPRNIPLRRPVWLMNTAAAMFLATLRTAQDIFAFPGMSVGAAAQGGGQNLLGIPVIASGNVPAGTITLLEQSQLMVADDGEVLIDTSTEASVQMDSAPDNPAVATTITVSAFQHNLALIRAERFCNWLKRRAAAVQYISGAKYA